MNVVVLGGQFGAEYLYDYLSRLSERYVASSNETTHYVHDLAGNIIAEHDGSGSVIREYIWLDERPVAVVDHSGVGPALYQVHTDHLERPVMMTDAQQAVVWEAVYLPFGGVHSITGSASLDQRFPGQWFQLETGLHYNWHRHYDPTTGRYIQADPLGMPDGPSRYAYVGNSPLMKIDPWGLAPPPANAWDPNGPKAPGYPGHYPPPLNGPLQWPGDPTGGPNWVPNPNPGLGGSSHGWEDRLGNVWCPTGQVRGRAHGGPHWDVQIKRSPLHENVYPPKQQENPAVAMKPAPIPWYMIPLLGILVGGGWLLAN